MSAARPRPFVTGSLPGDGFQPAAAPQTGHVEMTDLMSSREASLTEVEGLGPLLLAQGVDLARDAAPGAIDPGTPLYVDLSADPADVVRRMAEAHVRMLFVLSSGSVVGVIDAAELAERASVLLWGEPDAPRTTGGMGT